MVTRIRNTISPNTAFREMVLPQVGPTSCSLIWPVLIPALAARAARSWSPLSVGRPDEPEAAGEADAPGDGEACALADAEGDAWGEGEALALAEGLGVGVEAVPTWPRSVRLLDLMLMQPVGHPVPPLTSSTSDPERPNL